LFFSSREAAANLTFGGGAYAIPSITVGQAFCPQTDGTYSVVCPQEKASHHDARVAYYRVSTQQQGRSGLGIEAQKAAIARFAEAEGIEVVGEHVEVETGKGTDALDRRPQLAAALARARKAKCPPIRAEGPNRCRSTSSRWRWLR
jgi:Resolvase, N terminal domain